MRWPTFLAFSVALIFTCFPGTARAEDGPRFRGAASLHGGGVIVDDDGADGGVGIGGQIGIQIDDGWAVYAAPEVDFLFRECCGVAGSSLLVEHTWRSTVSVGAGPGAYLAVSFVPDGEPDEPGGGKYGWSQLGGDLRVAWHPIREVLDDNGGKFARRRVAFTVALQAGLYTAEGIGLIGMPRLAVGYTAF